MSNSTTVSFVSDTKVSGLYKRPGRHEVQMSFHVCHTVQHSGAPYLVGIRLDGAQQGSVQAVRADGFFMDTVSMEPAEHVELLTEEKKANGEFYLASGAPHFAFLEYVRNDLRVRAAREGGEPVMDCVVPSLVFDAHLVDVLETAAADAGVDVLDLVAALEAEPETEVTEVEPEVAVAA
jgi:hypothetical protein